MQNEVPVTIMLVNQYTSIVEINQLVVNSDGSWSGQIVLNPENRLRVKMVSTKLGLSMEVQR